MPAATTHVECAKQIYNKLNSDVKSKLTNMEMFYLGAQGPDLFFFSEAGFLPGTLRNLGSILHSSRVFDVIEFFFKYVNENKDNDLYSYIYGYLCHYALDSVVHPLVFYDAKYLGDKNESETINHFRIEAFLDVYTLKKEGKTINDYDVYKSVKVNENDANKLGVMYHAMFENIYNMDISTKKIAKTALQCSKFLKILSPTSKNKFNMISTVEKVVRQGAFISSLMLYNDDLKNSEDMLNNNHKKYFNINNHEIEYVSNFDELYEAGIEKGIKLLNDPLNETYYGIDFEGNPIEEYSYLFTIKK